MAYLRIMPEPRRPLVSASADYSFCTPSRKGHRPAGGPGERA